MKKGSKRKADIQQATKELIIEKGYSAVTMTDVGEQLSLSVGGLYYHYHSVEEIFLDLAANEQKDVWKLFEGVNDIESLIAAVEKYFELEKLDMLNFDKTLNGILMQYYMSFPMEKRRAAMQKDYLEVHDKMAGILAAVYKDPQVIGQICTRIYVMLHGLSFLAMTGKLTEAMIDHEFAGTLALLKELYEKTDRSGE